MRGRDGEPVVKVGMEEGMAYESREQFADAGADVAGLDAVEGREVEVGDEEGVVGGGHGGGGGEGGAGGGRGPRPGAEGAEWGGGREAGEEEEAGGGGRVWEAGGDGEWEACGGEEGGGKEKHGGGDEDSDVLTWAILLGLPNPNRWAATGSKISSVHNLHRSLLKKNLYRVYIYIL